MAAESEGTTLNREVVLRGVTEELKDVAKGIYLVARNDEGRPVASLMLTREWSVLSLYRRKPQYQLGVA